MVVSSVQNGSAARLWVLAASFALGAVGLYWIADAFVIDGSFRFGNPVPEASQPLQVRAEVVRVDGNAGVGMGDECLFLVERHALPDDTVECRAQISCGGVLLYGGPRRGYFACALQEDHEVLGTDPATTRTDGDAAMHLDTSRGLLRIHDDGFGAHGELSLEAEVIDVVH